MNRVSAFALFALLGMAGCGKSFEAVVEERRTEAEPKLEQIEQVGRKSLSFHEVLKDISLPNDERLQFNNSPNAALVQAELFDANNPRPQLDLTINSEWLTRSRNALSDSPTEIDGDTMAGLFDKLIAIKYLVVVRTRILAKPSAAGGGMFSPGLWQGELMVFEVESEEFLGGAPLTASNSDDVKVDTKDPETWLHSDLWKHARAAIREALAPHSLDSPLE